MNDTKSTISKALIDELSKLGVQYGTSRKRKHPSTRDYCFGAKNNAVIFDLEKTVESLDNALSYISELGKAGKKILFVGNRNEVKKVVKEAAEELTMPYVTERWIGGTLTNFDEIKKRTDYLDKLRDQDQKGELVKYKKKERVRIQKEMVDLERIFFGIKDMKELPSAMFVIDAKREEIAVKEANDMNIPVIGICGSDNDITNVNYPIIGNDKSIKSVNYFINKVVDVYKAAKQ